MPDVGSGKLGAGTTALIAFRPLNWYLNERLQVGMPQEVVQDLIIIASMIFVALFPHDPAQAMKNFFGGIAAIIKAWRCRKECIAQQQQTSA